MGGVSGWPEVVGASVVTMGGAALEEGQRLKSLLFCYGLSRRVEVDDESTKVFERFLLGLARSATKGDWRRRAGRSSSGRLVI